MTLITIIFTAIALSMDAFAVAVCKGLAIKKITTSNMLKIGIWFGLFQAIMPLLGYLLSYRFGNIVVSINHWVAFVLLLLIGINMIKESIKKETVDLDNSLSIKNMFILSIVVSIDAFAIGITFAFLNVNIIYSTILIGIITLILSTIGVKIGNIFGLKYKEKAELVGGIILIVIGIKILFEHLM